MLVLSFIRLQMHHPIQMKPADSENRNGKSIRMVFTFSTSDDDHIRSGSLVRCPWLGNNVTVHNIADPYYCRTNRERSRGGREGFIPKRQLRRMFASCSSSFRWHLILVAVQCSAEWSELDGMKMSVLYSFCKCESRMQTEIADMSTYFTSSLCLCVCLC